MTSFLDFAYTIVALIVAGLLVYVMQKAEHDRINVFDSVWVQWLRRLSFIVAALVLLYSISSTNWQVTSLLLVSASGIILAINAAALNMRVPPNHGGKMRSSSFGFSYFLSRLAHYFSALR